ncbi:MAG: GlxA family transcriptional regulator, partial [Pseudomonadota bacterium]|nr:GlxA family transcriptional regulator [Pseudomonadota bacterium]
MRPQHFIFLLVENHTHLTLACAIEPLRIANMISGQTLYSWSYASEDGKTSRASNDTVSLVQCAFRDIPKGDRLFV